MEAKKFYKELRLLLEEQERGILEEIAGSRARLQEERAREVVPLERQLGGARRARAFGARCSDIELGQFALHFEGLCKPPSPTKAAATPPPLAHPARTRFFLRHAESL